jgi:alpha-glucosidase
VDTQDGVADSVLTGYRTFLRWRRDMPALRRGGIELLATDEPALAMIRSLGDEQLLAGFNLGAESCSVALPEPVASRSAEPVTGHGLAQGEIRSGRLALPAHGVLFARLSGAAAGEAQE